MSQEMVLNVLKSNPRKWFTVNELFNILHVGKGSLHLSTKKLFKYGFVDRKQFIERGDNPPFTPRRFYKYRFKYVEGL